jgi:hypothetical protein
MHTCKTNMFSYTTVCLFACTIVLPYPRYQSKSLNEISPNPLGLRDRQSTTVLIRFEKSISAV